MQNINKNYNNGPQGGGDSNRNESSRYNESSRHEYNNRGNDYSRNQYHGQGQGSTQSQIPAAAVSQPPGIPVPNRSTTYDHHQMNQPKNLVNDTLPVPTELSQFVADPQFQQILLRVKEQSKINFITVNRTAERLAGSISITAATEEAALLARKLLEIHFKQHMKVKLAETRLARVQTDLFSAQGEMASGMIVHFTINPDLVGIAIGKKGARIKQVEKDSGVTSVNVDGKSGQITVVGPDAPSVQQAREMLELFTETFELKAHQIEYLSHDYSMLADIKATSDAMVARVDRATNTMIIIGTSGAVRSVRLMLDTQMEYVDKQIEIEMTERKAREDLSAFKKQYNLYSPNSRGDGEGRGDGRDRGEGNRERGNGNRGARGGDRGRGGGGGGGGGGGAEGTGAWGHHDEDHRDSTNNGNRRDRDDRYGGRGGGGGGGNSKGAVSKEKSAGTSRSVKASDSGNAPSSESRSKNRGGASEAPLIAIPLPPTSHDEGGGSSNRQANRRGNKSKVEPVKIEEPEGAKSEGKRRRAGAATVDGAESSLANMSISSDSTGARAFEVAAAASAAKNAPKMEKKIVDRDSNDKDKADAADKASRKTRNTNSNGNGYGSAASKDAKADATPTTFTVVLNVDPRTTEGTSTSQPKKEGAAKSQAKKPVPIPAPAPAAAAAAAPTAATAAASASTVVVATVKAVDATA